MNRTKLVLTVSSLVVLSTFALAETPTPPRAYLQIVGAKQGTFKGEAARVAGTNYIAVLSFSYSVNAPFDPATGMATGKREHHPLIITKALDATSPQISGALASNETLTKVTLEFMQSSAAGKEMAYYTITLTNARISEVRQHMDQTNPGAAGSSVVPSEPMEDVSFTFEQMAVTSAVGQTMATDSWNAELK